MQRIATVECLRGIAAIGVMWFHFTNGSEWLPDGVVKASGSMGWLGVEVFFVISGFVIPYSMAMAKYRLSDAGRFLLRRLIRLEPAYLFAIAISLGLLLLSAQVRGFRGSPPAVTAPQVFLHVGYLNPFFGYPWLNPVFWSLAIELQFYLLMSILFPIFRQRWKLVVFVIFCVSALVAPSKLFAFHYSGLFALGIAAWLRYNDEVSNIVFASMAGGAVSVTALTLGIPHAAAGLATALIITYVSLPSLPIITFAGALSYSLYLMHVPIGGRVINLLSRVADDWLTRGFALATATICSFGAAYFLLRYVEGPAKRCAAHIQYRHQRDKYSAETAAASNTP